MNPVKHRQYRGCDEDLVDVDRQKRVEASLEGGLEANRCGAREQGEPGDA